MTSHNNSKKPTLAELFPELAKQWHPIKNAGVTPDEVTKGSHKKVWWICDNGHEWDAPIRSRAKGSGCPYCIGRRLGDDNNLAAVMPHLAREWNTQKNGDLKASDCMPKSGRRVWWKCEKGHEWEAAISNRSSGTGCPHCYKESRRKK